MARKAVISRTFTGMQIKALCLNISDKTPFEKEIYLSREPDSVKKLEHICREIVNTDEVRFVSVIEANPIRKRYGMLESDFIANAFELPLLTTGEDNGEDFIEDNSEEN